MIIRTPDRDRFLIISKVPLEDTRLSWKAKGLLSFLLSKPDGWTVIVGYLVKKGPDGKASVMAGLRELEAAGYLRRDQKRRDDERFDGIDSVIYEEPVLPGHAESRFSASGKAVDGKSATNEEGLLVKKDFTKRRISQNDEDYAAERAKIHADSAPPPEGFAESVKKKLRTGQ